MVGTKLCNYVQPMGRRMVTFILRDQIKSSSLILMGILECDLLPTVHDYQYWAWTIHVAKVVAMHPI